MKNDPEDEFQQKNEFEDFQHIIPGANHLKTEDISDPELASLPILSEFEIEKQTKEADDEIFY